MSTENLKKELEAVLSITKWEPTEKDLTLIAQKIENLRGRASKSDIAKIVLEVVGPYKCIFLEGIDNTDLTTLLLMATKTVRK